MGRIKLTSVSPSAPDRVQDCEQFRLIIALAAKGEGLHGPEHRVRPPIRQRAWTNACCRRLHAAEYSTTGGPRKRKSCRVDCHCPNVSTERDQPTADVGPIVSVVR